MSGTLTGMDTTSLIDTYLDAYGEPDRARRGRRRRFRCRRARRRREAAARRGFFGPLPDAA
jgi:hypothetical protein